MEDQSYRTRRARLASLVVRRLGWRIARPQQPGLPGRRASPAALPVLLTMRRQPPEKNSRPRAGRCLRQATAARIYAVAGPGPSDGEHRRHVGPHRVRSMPFGVSLPGSG